MIEQINSIQWSTDAIRLLKIALRNHDAEAVAAVYERISKKFGADITNQVIVQTITDLIDSENWSFFDTDGNPSPLL